MNRSMHKRAQRQKLMNELNGMAGKAAILPNPNSAKKQFDAMVEASVKQIGSQVYAELACEILLDSIAKEDAAFPAADLLEASKASHLAAKIYLAASGVNVPGVEIRKDDDTEETSEFEENEEAEKPVKPEIVDDEEPRSDIIAMP